MDTVLLTVLVALAEAIAVGATLALLHDQFGAREGFTGGNLAGGCTIETLARHAIVLYPLAAVHKVTL